MAKNKIWIKKIAAGFLLLLLVSITLVQQSHSHANSAVSQQQKKDLLKKEGAVIHYKSFSESKCFICEYQLARDADVNRPISPLKYSALFIDTLPVTYFIVLSGTHSVFENRGPPHTA